MLVLIHLDGQRCELMLDESFAHLLSERWQARLEHALQAVLKRAIKLEVRLGRSEVETPAILRQRRQQEKLAATDRSIAED